MTYKSLPVAEKIQAYWNRRARLVIVTALTILCAAATIYFHMIFGVEIVFTHLFYIPIAFTYP